MFEMGAIPSFTPTEVGSRLIFSTDFFGGCWMLKANELGLEARTFGDAGLLRVETELTVV